MVRTQQFMPDDIDVQLDALLEYLKVKKTPERFDVTPTKGYYDTNENKVYLDSELKERMRQILGIDKRCFNCQKWKFKYELTNLEGSALLVCQDCAEEIINGKTVIPEESAYSETGKSQQ